MKKDIRDELISKHKALLLEEAKLVAEERKKERYDESVASVDSIKKSANKKEKSGMDISNIFGEFGKTTKGELALTLTGEIAVKRNNNEFVRYNKDTETMENQLSMVLEEASDLIFIIPVNEVKEGDIIKYKNTYYQILGQKSNGSISVVNIKDGSKKTIIKETNLLGLSFYYKVICLFSIDSNTTTNGVNPALLMMLSNDSDNVEEMLPMIMMGLFNKDNKESKVASPMENMNPMMMMLMLKDKDKDMDMKSVVMMQMMQSMQGGGQINPMMMMLMMKDGGVDMKSLVIMQMMQAMQNNSSVEK